jgi:hypothetical protein
VGYCRNRQINDQEKEDRRKDQLDFDLDSSRGRLEAAIEQPL